MKTTNKATEDYTGREFIITYEFQAPRALVFQAWTDPKHLAQWWGPRGFTNPVCQWDARPGQTIHVVMRAPNGTDYPMGGEFREITPPEKLVFTSGPLDESGALIFEFLHTALFTEQNGKTLLTLRSRVLKTTPAANKYIGGFEAGMTQSLEKLAEQLSSKPLVVIRQFDAPAEMVFDAWLDPKAVGQWLFATPDGKMERIEIDARVGGKYSIAEKRGEDVVEHCGTYIEINRPRRLVFDFSVPKYSAISTLVTIDIVPNGSRCELTLTHERVLPEYRVGTVSGWTMILNNLAATTSAGRAITISRDFDAPRERIWEAMTNPSHLVNWWGLRGFTTTVEKMDFRVGGEWTQVMHGPDGANYPNRHVFEEIVKPARIVYSHAGKREGGPSASSVATWTFDEIAPGKTKVTIHMVFPTAAERDFVVKEFGAIEGARQTLERLDLYLPTISP